MPIPERERAILRRSPLPVKSSIVVEMVPNIPLWHTSEPPGVAKCTTFDAKSVFKMISVTV